jgi:glutamine synthetase
LPLTQFIFRKAEKDHEINFLVGFETEVIFLEDGIYPPLPISNHAWSTSLAMRSASVGKAIVEEIYDVLTDAGIEVQQFHAESAPGQYEIVTGPLPPIEAVDTLVFTRDTIYNVAAKHGVRATLYPKVFKDACISSIRLLI